MFRTCIHCNGALGANEAFESFPVGSRLAFDAKRGRLWVICRACARWNLSPLDERWEAIEAMEIRFRDTRLRVSTDNVGLARLREGVDLIRIGEPQRPEMAAWRYGDQFGRRRKRQLLVTSAVLGSAAAIIGSAYAVGVGSYLLSGIYSNRDLWETLLLGRQSISIGHVRLDDGQLVELHRRHARMSALIRDDANGEVQLRLESLKGTHVLTGDNALQAAQRIMTTVNRFGGSPSKVRDAVQLLDQAGDPKRVWLDIQQRNGWKAGESRWGGGGLSNEYRHRIQKLPGTLHALPARERLALEMALHDETERRAMEGELHLLEQAWREAEEIARIADDMFTPAQIEERLKALRRAVPAPSS